MSDTKTYVLPVSLEACIEHVKAMMLNSGGYMQVETRQAIEETHEYIEKHMQMLGGHEELVHCDNCGKPTKHISLGWICEECLF